VRPLIVNGQRDYSLASGTSQERTEHAAFSANWFARRVLWTARCGTSVFTAPRPRRSSKGRERIYYDYYWDEFALEEQTKATTEALLKFL